MKQSFSQPADTSTPAGARLETPWGMTKEIMRVAWFAMLTVAAVVIGIAFAVISGRVEPALIGLLLAIPPSFVAWVLWRYVRRTERMVYPDGQAHPIIADGPTVVFVRDRVQTPKGAVDKDPMPVDVGLPPAEARRVLRWMKETGKTSRRDVTEGAGISQGAWAKLKNALQDFGILEGGKLTDEIDYLLAQLDDL
jgi:hypothetical protein